MPAHILVVEDDDQTRVTLAYQLAYAGYRVTQAADGEAAIALLEAGRFDVVLSDIIMEGQTGLEVLCAARGQAIPPQVILLTGHGTLDTSLAAFRAGAFDYLLKPCEPEDLLACVARAVERHTAEDQLQTITRLLTGRAPTVRQPTQSDPAKRVLQVGALRVGATRHEVTFAGAAVHLTPIEYALLRFLAEEPGKVRRFREVVLHTHGVTADDMEAQQLLKPHIHNLRRKLSPDYFTSQRGVGYLLAVPGQSA